MKHSKNSTAPNVRSTKEGQNLETAREHREDLFDERETDQPSGAEVITEVRSGTGELKAVRIRSHTLEADIWMIRDKSFKPRKGLAVFFEKEIPMLKKKSLEELRDILRYKLIFPGCRLVTDEAGPASMRGASKEGCDSG